MVRVGVEAEEGVRCVGVAKLRRSLGGLEAELLDEVCRSMSRYVAGGLKIGSAGSKCRFGGRFGLFATGLLLKLRRLLPTCYA